MHNDVESLRPFNGVVDAKKTSELWGCVCQIFGQMCVARTPEHRFAPQDIWGLLSDGITYKFYLMSDSVFYIANDINYFEKTSFLYALITYLMKYKAFPKQTQYIALSRTDRQRPPKYLKVDDTINNNNNTLFLAKTSVPDPLTATSPTFNSSLNSLPVLKPLLDKTSVPVPLIATSPTLLDSSIVSNPLSATPSVLNPPLDSPQVSDPLLATPSVLNLPLDSSPPNLDPTPPDFDPSFQTPVSESESDTDSDLEQFKPTISGRCTYATRSKPSLKRPVKFKSPPKIYRVKRSVSDTIRIHTISQSDSTITGSISDKLGNIKLTE